MKKKTAQVVAAGGVLVGLIGCYYGLSRRRKERILRGEIELDDGRTLSYEERTRYASLRTSRTLGGRR